MSLSWLFFPQFLGHFDWVKYHSFREFRPGSADFPLLEKLVTRVNLWTWGRNLYNCLFFRSITGLVILSNSRRKEVGPFYRLFEAKEINMAILFDCSTAFFSSFTSTSVNCWFSAFFSLNNIFKTFANRIRVHFLATLDIFDVKYCLLPAEVYWLFPFPPILCQQWNIRSSSKKSGKLPTCRMHSIPLLTSSADNSKGSFAMAEINLRRLHSRRQPGTDLWLSPGWGGACQRRIHCCCCSPSRPTAASAGLGWILSTSRRGTVDRLQI